MNVFAKFDENPSMTFQNINETKRYGHTHARTVGRTDGVKTVYPPQTQLAGYTNEYSAVRQTNALKSVSSIKSLPGNLKMGLLQLCQCT